MSLYRKVHFMLMIAHLISSFQYFSLSLAASVLYRHAVECVRLSAVVRMKMKVILINAAGRPTAVSRVLLSYSLLVGSLLVMSLCLVRGVTGIMVIAVEITAAVLY